MTPSIDASSKKVADSIETAPSKARNLALNAESDSAPNVGKGSPAAVAALGPPKFKSQEEKRQYFKEHMAGALRYMGAEGTFHTSFQKLLLALSDNLQDTAKKELLVTSLYGIRSFQIISG